MKFEYAIVRKPGHSFKNGLSDANLGVPDFGLALDQHADYVDALKECGLDVIELIADERFPDGCFVEDTAIVTDKCAIITQPGHPTRKGEEVRIETIIKEYRPIERISGSGTVDGGDIMQADKHFFIGLSERTNTAGANQLSSILQKHGYTASKVTVNNILHLKSGVNYIGNNTVSIMENLYDLPDFKSFEKIPIIPEESYASNCVLINEHLIMAKGFKDTKKKFEKAGYKIIELDMSEYMKMDGGLSCLSLRF